MRATGEDRACPPDGVSGPLHPTGCPGARVGIVGGDGPRGARETIEVAQPNAPPEPEVVLRSEHHGRHQGRPLRFTTNAI